MTRFLLDVNTVLALLDRRHVHHEAAHAWVDRTPGARWLTCPMVQNGVIRVGSQSAYPNHLGTAAMVREVLRDFCASTRHEFCPDDVSLLEEGRLIHPFDRLTPSRVSDLYLLALAHQHGAKLATFDRKIPPDAVVGGRESLEHIVA